METPSPETFETIEVERRRLAVERIVALEIEDMPDPDELSRQLNDRYSRGTFDEVFETIDLAERLQLVDEIARLDGGPMPDPDELSRQMSERYNGPLPR